MVHNGIEYGYMQLICEAYQLDENTAHFFIVKAKPCFHQLIRLADELHIAIFNAVMHHLHKMTCPVFAYPVTAWRSVLDLCTDRLKNRFDIRPCRRAAARHHTWPLQSAFLSAGDSGAHIQKSF